MNNHLDKLSLLQCPYCQAKLVLDYIDPTNDQFGTVHCECDVYPFVKGILFLKKDPQKRNQVATELVRTKKYPEALKILLLEERKITRWVYQLICRFSLPWDSFLALLRFLVPGSRPWLEYLLHRNQRVTFLLSVATLSWADKKSIIADIGCGAGHFLRQARQLLPDSFLIGADNSFSLLLLARTYMLDTQASSSLLICVDLDGGLPFQRNSLDFVSINDAFMYFYHKRFVLAELERVMKPKARTFITHIHHRQAVNLGQGYGVTVEELKTLMPNLTAFIASDREMLSHIYHQKTVEYLPLARQTKEEHFLNSFSLLLTKDKKGLATHRVPLQIYELFDPAKIEFSEDEYLQKELG